MKEDSYEYWYKEALVVTEQAGYSCWPLTDVIRDQAQEIEQLRAEVARLEEIEWMYNDLKD